MNIGVDVSYQFEPEYMSMLANSIIDKIDMDVELIKRSATKTKKMFIKKTRAVIVHGVSINMSLNDYWYDRIFDQKFLDQTNKKFLKPEEAQDFV